MRESTISAHLIDSLFHCDHNNYIIPYSVVLITIIFIMFFYYAGVSMVLQYKKRTVLLQKAYNNINTIISVVNNMIIH